MVQVVDLVMGYLTNLYFVLFVKFINFLIVGPRV